jgi:hypothetical protein
MSKKKQRTTITLDLFHKKIIEDRIKNLSRFVRERILELCENDYGTIRHLKTIHGILYILYIQDFESAKEIINTEEISNKIKEAIDDINNILKGFDIEMETHPYKDPKYLVKFTKKGFEVISKTEEHPTTSQVFAFILYAIKNSFNSITKIKIKDKDLWFKINYVQHLLFDNISST